ncbi:MAG: phosphoribosylformylglycinamidine cyclo-ligase [Thermoplasmata archaeon]|nr:phosphoribosylformylglycinamidine cyclo-ligase [Thermoplasmata archaeon]
MKLTYSDAGVDIDKKADAIDALVKSLGYDREGMGKKIKLPGGYAGLVEFGPYALALSTDTVGTKLLVANEVHKWDTLGIDNIAMSANDMICLGAEPLSFVDFISIDVPDEEITGQLGVGLEAGAKMANITIIGGEIAVVPELVNTFDFGGTCLGWIKREEIITGQDIREGDVIIGLESTGIHCNGLTLARKIVEVNQIPYDEKFEKLGRTIGLELLEPTKIYVREIMRIIKDFKVHGMANITGGGLRNYIRLKKGVRFNIDEPIKPQPIFDILAQLGEVSDEEMYQTFNMGMGYTIVAPEDQAEGIIQGLKPDVEARIVGTVEKGSGVTCPPLSLEYLKY